MHNVEVPAGSQSDAGVGSVAACLASMLELRFSEVPAPPPDHPEPWTVWGNWLAQRGLGLAPVLEPAGFQWPGPWLALVRSEQHGELVGAVAFGAPPGLAWNPLGGPETFAAVERGYIVAPADPALWAPQIPSAARTAGSVESVAVAAVAEGPMTLVQQVVARSGRGLAGDRYFDGAGTFSNAHGKGHDLTLVEAEALDGLALPAGRVAVHDLRRNVVTRGIDLNALVGRFFTVGDVLCFGQRRCQPCAHLERLTVPGTLRGLVHRGGLRADVLSDGVVRVGDAVAPAEPGGPALISPG